MYESENHLHIEKRIICRKTWSICRKRAEIMYCWYDSIENKVKTVGEQENIEAYVSLDDTQEIKERLERVEKELREIKANIENSEGLSLLDLLLLFSVGYVLLHYVIIPFFE